MKFLVKLYQQTILLQVIAKVAGLAVVDALVFVIEGVRVHGHQCLESGNVAGFYSPLQSRQTPIRVSMNTSVFLPALLVERAQAFIQPRWAGGEVRFHKWMHNLMHQSTTACTNVHDKRLVMTRIVSIGSSGFFPKDEPVMFLVRGFIFEEPDIQDRIRIFDKKILLQFIDGPLHRTLCSTLHLLSGFVAHDDEG